MKALNQLNLYESKDKRYKEVLVEKQLKAQVTTEDKASQTDKIIPKDFRKQWIGKSEGIPFDDSLILDYRSQIYIKGALIYKTTEQICCIKFYYESVHKKRYEGKVPLEAGVLRKFDSKKHMARGQAYLQKFNLSITSDKVTRIQLVWSDGEIVSEGWENEGSTRYVGDIAE